MTGLRTPEAGTYRKGKFLSYHKADNGQCVDLVENLNQLEANSARMHFCCCSCLILASSAGVNGCCCPLLAQRFNHRQMQQEL
jgi:hypothetical protein